MHDELRPIHLFSNKQWPEKLQATKKSYRCHKKKTIVKKYLDSKGKVRVVGNRWLKKSESGPRARDVAAGSAHSNPRMHTACQKYRQAHEACSRVNRLGCRHYPEPFGQAVMKAIAPIVLDGPDVVDIEDSDEEMSSQVCPVTDVGIEEGVRRKCNL